jgi:hypothetical protein
MLEAEGAAVNAANLGAFRRGLQELGYVEGQHFVIEYPSADGRAARFPDLARELVQRAMTENGFYVIYAHERWGQGRGDR